LGFLFPHPVLQRIDDEAEKRMLRRMFLVSELQRNWSGGPRVPAKISARESDRQFALHVGRMATIYRKPADQIDMGPVRASVGEVEGWQGRCVLVG
jgi:hypothetical protein